MKPIRITHVITGLSIGGAEKVLLRLLREMDTNGFENNVISLTDMGALSESMIATGTIVSAMNFLKGNVNVMPVAHLGAELRSQKPDLVQTWMYHADLIGGIAARLTTSAPVLWNLRQSTLDETHSKKSTIRTAMACARLSSSLPSAIVCGSHSACRVHTELGYDAANMVVLNNGFDTNVYSHSPEQRAAFRAKLGITEDTILIGNPSRYDPQKDHRMFLQAAARVAQKVPNAHFVLCGDSITSENQELSSIIKEQGLSERVHILGTLKDINPFYSAIDILVLSSAYGEGAPNVIGEAMSAEVPCVATDVGDSAYLIDDTGLIVPARNAHALADAVVSLSQDSCDTRKAKGQAARLRIKHHFPLTTMVRRYEDLYRRVYSQRYDF
ncbi:MAG: glycosyltransferase [Rhodospirillales bacterium]|nr:glycosyltransferase [Rhodospirillales bacterium]